VTEVEISELVPGDRRGFEGYAAVWNTVVPREPVTAQEIEARRSREGDRSFAARVDWAIAGCASAVRSHLPGRTYVAIAVLPEFRRRGVGSALLARALDVARAHGSQLISLEVEEGDAAGAAFGARLGLVPRMREVEESRRLRGDEPEPEPPAGIELVVAASRPGLVEAAYEVARSALAELPLPAAYEISPFERWAAEEATGDGVIAEATLVALDGDQVVGFAGLLRRRADPRLAEHGITVVAPTHRNRGIATALKQAQIAWAARHGYRELMTFTQDGNDAMQAVNAKLGYDPRPAWIRLEAPVEEVAAALALEPR
jgi:GNAT superfamily N-acetyltransferase